MSGFNGEMLNVVSAAWDVGSVRRGDATGNMFDFMGPPGQGKDKILKDMLVISRAKFHLCCYKQLEIKIL